MPIPNQVTRVALVGRSAGGEIWETGYWLHSAPTSLADANTLANSLADIHTTTTVSIIGYLKQNQWHPSLVFSYVRVYSYPSGGPAAAFTGQSTDRAIPGVLATTSMLPHQVAWCATLNTGAAGRSNRGRSYFPISNPGTLAQTGQRPTLDCTTAAQAYARDLAMVTSTVAPYVPVVLSQKLASTRTITSVRFDSRLDIQRRRANREAIQVGASASV
jgi:hypothetical protein